MNNIGSITRIEYVYAEEVASVSSPDSQGYVTVTLENGASFQELEFTPESASLREEQSQTDNGDLWDQQLTLRMPKVTSVTNVLIQEWHDHNFVFRITDGNGVAVLLGTDEVPSRYSLGVHRPAATSGYNGFELTFSCRSADPMPLVLGEDEGGVS